MRNFVFVLISAFAFNCKAQNVSLSQVVNLSYQRGDIISDTLFYFQGSCKDYVEIDNKSEFRIKIIKLKNKEELLSHLSLNKNSYILHICILEFTPELCKLKFEISETDQSIYKKENKYLSTSVDERIVQCRYDSKAKNWLYDKTLKVYAHPPIDND